MISLAVMDNASSVADSADTQRLETDAERQARYAWDADDIARADADIAAGRMVDAVAVRAWAESIGTAHELPIPYSAPRA